MRMYQNLGLCPYDSYKYEHPWIYKDQVILGQMHLYFYLMRPGREGRPEHNQNISINIKIVTNNKIIS